MTKFKNTLAAATLAAAAFAIAPAASAGDYRKCKDTEAAVAGGLIGGSLGTIIGEEIAGRGDKTEGAIAGAVIGGVIGAAIGDGASDCEKDGRIYRNGRYIGDYNRGYQTRGYPQTRTHYPNTRRVSHPGHGNAYGHRNRGYDRGYDGYNRGYDQRDRQLRQIDRQIRDLREERRFLKDRARYEGYSRGTERRLNRIARRLDRLKDDRKRVKRGDYGRSYDRGYRNSGYRNGGHYHGSNLCYSNH